MKSWSALVEVFSAFSGAAVAGDLDILDGELVVVGQLLAPRDAATGEDDDVLLAADLDHPGETVGLKLEHDGHFSIHPFDWWVCIY